MFEVAKVPNTKFFAVVDHRGDYVSPGYRDRSIVERIARGNTVSVFDAAEIENERRDRIKTYVAIRADRVYAPAAQLELF